MPAKAQDYPSRIVIEPTNRCNLRCQMCAQVFRDFSYSMLDIDIVRRMESAYPHIDEAALFGWGEPLLHPRFGEMFDIISRHPIRTYITTNGLLLEDDLAAMFVDRGLDFLAFSFDGARRETYNRIRAGSDYDRVLDGIRSVVKYRQQRGSDKPFMRFTMVLMKSTICELPELVDLAAELGLGEVRGIYLVAYDETLIDETLIHHPELIPDSFAAAREAAERHGIALRLPPAIGEKAGASRAIGPKGCLRPFDDAFVQADGFVRPCVISNEIMGDLHEQSFEEIWRGERYEDFRRRIRSSNPPGECVTCHQCNFLDVNDIRAHVAIENRIPETK